MRIVKNPAERKQEILEGAIHVFAKKGYEKTSMSDIARELNISQGLCYRYFPSKEAVYDEALDFYAEHIVERHVEDWEKEEKTFREMIVTHSGNFAEYHGAEIEMQDLFALFHGEESKKMHEQLILAVGRKLIPYMVRLLERAQSTGELPVLDSYIMAHMIVFGQIGVMMDEQISGREKKERIQKTILKLLEK